MILFDVLISTGTNGCGLPGSAKSQIVNIFFYESTIFWADAWFHFHGKKSYRAITVSFWRHHVDFAVFKKKIHMKEVHHGNVCKAENGVVRQRRGAQIIYSSLYSIRINAYRHVCQLKSTKHYKNVQEHLHILGMVYLATVARIIQLVSGRSIRIAE